MFNLRSLLLALVALLAVNNGNAFQMAPIRSGVALRTALTTKTSGVAFESIRPTATLLKATATAAAADVTASTPAAPVAAKKPAPKTLKKILPLGAMLFFILFNYTILRDTKDVLVVTAPNSGAEIIPFLKTYVNLPSAIAFTVIYGTLSNTMPSDKVFYLVMTSFLAFFGAFAGIICKLSLSSNNLFLSTYMSLFFIY